MRTVVLNKKQANFVIEVVLMTLKMYLNKKNSQYCSLEDLMQLSEVFTKHPQLVSIVSDVAIASYPNDSADALIKNMLELQLENCNEKHKKIDTQCVVDIVSNYTVMDVRKFSLTKRESRCQR